MRILCPQAALPAFVASILAGSCIEYRGTWEGSRWTTVVDEPPVADPLLVWVDASCVGSTWTFGAETEGWTGGAALTLRGPDAADTGGAAREEVHDLPSVDFGQDGTWDLLQLRLDVDEGDPDPDLVTGFPCSAEAEMGFRIVVWNEAGARADCAVWGAESAALADGEDCLVWGR